MEKVRYLCLWADEGFVGTKEQRQVLVTHLTKAEKLLFESNVYLSRLYNHIPVNLMSRVSDQPVWLPSMVKWLKEKFKADHKREGEPKPKRRSRPREQTNPSDNDQGSSPAPS